MLEPLLERLTVLNVYLMLNGTGTTQLIALQGKHVVVSQK